MKPFDPSLVVLRDDVFAPRQQRLQTYLREFDLDRLMHTFRLNAGIPSDAKPLGGWEAPECPLRGHFVGHFLSACAQFGHGLQDRQLTDKALKIADIMRQCMREDGYLSAFEESILDTLERNETHGVWAPYYALHKVLAGLIDCGKLLDYAPAIETALRLALYIHRRFAALSDWKIDGMLRCTRTNPTNEFGGIGDALYSLWELTGEQRVLELAKLFDRPYFLEPLRAGRDVLTNLHANTHLPMVLAAGHRYALTGEDGYRQAVKNFYSFLKRRTFANGNSSGRAEQFLPGELSGKAEHWGAPLLDASYLTGGESECCCAYNTEKLLTRLLEWEDDMAALDHLEELKYNALLNSASAQTGLSQYHQPMGFRQQKKFSSYDQDFWCCTGSGLETMALLQNNLWFRRGDAALVNQFVSSDLHWTEKDAVLSLRTSYPKSLQAEITVCCEKETGLTLMLKKHRVSDVRCSAKDCTISEENGFVVIRGCFCSGDSITMNLASPVRRESISAKEPDTYCVKYGPILLARVRRDELVRELPVIPVEGQEKDDVWIPWYLVEDEVYSIYSLSDTAAGAPVEVGKQM